MLYYRLMKRFHGPIACLCVASVFAVGCTAGAGKHWGKEEVRLPRPSRALAAEDGSLLLSFFVERQLQPDYTGWHWLVVEPGKARELLTPVPATKRNAKHPTVDEFVWVHWSGKNASAQMQPPLLEPGLADASELPGGFANASLTALTLHRDQRWGGHRLQSTDDPGEPSTPRLLVTPDSQTYQSAHDARSEQIAKAVAFPFRVVGAAVAFPIMLVSAVALVTVWIFLIPSNERFRSRGIGM